MMLVPALAVAWLAILSAYWLMGIIKWPRARFRDRFLEWCGDVDIEALGGAKLLSLAGISLISLFLELLLIRWITSEIRVFAYFKSLVLIACFFGFGFGCFLANRRVRIAHLIVPLVAMVFLTDMPWTALRFLVYNLSGFIGWFSDVHIWTRSYFSGQFALGLASATIAMSIVIPLFGLIALTFVTFGQLVGWYLEHAENGVTAYSVNVAASIAGIWLFALLCFYSTPPLVWMAATGIALVLFFRRQPNVMRSVLVGFVVIVLILIAGNWKKQWFGELSWKGATQAEYELKPGEVKTYWSPYQKLSVVPLNQGNETVRYILNTNDSWYQQILNLSDSFIAKHPELNPWDRPMEFFQYNLPYQFYNKPPTVLIAGSGMGNDVASALRHGAGHITAVEIDPFILDRGRALHLEHPYSSDRVEVHVDDARAFLHKTKEKYDLIVFSILDSHTTSSHYTNIRLDNYVYTIEAMRTTRNLLKDNGLFVMSFSAERPWFAKHLHDIVVDAFGKEPLMVQTNVVFFVVGPNNRAQEAVQANPELRKFLEANSKIDMQEASLVTDDWPYLYMQYRSIPGIIWILSVAVVGVCWLAFRQVTRVSQGVWWHFFFLGAAFMLLEVQIISRCALLFGTTWMVNCVIITGLLLFILLANVVAAKVPRFPVSIAYAGLFATLAICYFVPTSALFFDSPVTRALATGLYCLPVFFAGLIFISSFARIGFRAEALGSNLFGSLVGGLLESLSFVVGIKALVLIAAAMYFLSLLTIKARPSAAGQTPIPSPAM
jgi:hypothetical protein